VEEIMPDSNENVNEIVFERDFEEAGSESVGIS
jgi:hypothetical protein